MYLDAQRRKMATSLTKDGASLHDDLNDSLQVPGNVFNRSSKMNIYD